MNFKQQETIETWARTQGTAKVRAKAIEELAELIRGIAIGDIANIAEEIADCEIMLIQLKEVLRHQEDSFAEMVVSEIASKVERIQGMIDQHNKPKTYSGHGHVVQTVDGMKFPCGGPEVCFHCSNDLELKKREAQLADEVAG